jgi:hypothetical protein
MWWWCWWFYSQWHIHWTIPLGADPGVYQVVHIGIPAVAARGKGVRLHRHRCNHSLSALRARDHHLKLLLLLQSWLLVIATLRALTVVPVQSDILRGTRFYRFFMSTDKRHKRWNLHIVACSRPWTQSHWQSWPVDNCFTELTNTGPQTACCLISNLKYTISVMPKNPPCSKTSCAIARQDHNSIYPNNIMRQNPANTWRTWSNPFHFWPHVERHYVIFHSMSKLNTH